MNFIIANHLIKREFEYRDRTSFDKSPYQVSYL